MSPDCLRRRTANLVLVLMIAPAAARAEPLHAVDRLSKILKAGDLIEIADTSGRQIRGRVTDLTDCSIVITPSDANRTTVRWNDVKKIRRVRPARSSDIAAAAQTCESRDCPPLTLVVSSLAGVAHGFGAIFNRPKTIYRAPKQPVVSSRLGTRLSTPGCRHSAIFTIKPSRERSKGPIGRPRSGKSADSV